MIYGMVLYISTWNHLLSTPYWLLVNMNMLNTHPAMTLKTEEVCVYSNNAFYYIIAIANSSVFFLASGPAKQDLGMHQSTSMTIEEEKGRDEERERKAKNVRG